MAATRVLGKLVGLDLIRFMATREDIPSGFFWNDVEKALPHYPPSSVRRCLDDLEDAGVIRVDAPVDSPRGKRRGYPVKFHYQPDRLDQLFAATRQWITGESETLAHDVPLESPAPAEQ